MKTIISIWHSSNKGKTRTIREVANYLLQNYTDTEIIYSPPNGIPDQGDFRIVLRVKGKIIGIETQGDPGTGLEKRLSDLADIFNCDIIICSSRTRGETVMAIENVANTRDYQTIWTSTYQIGNNILHEQVNKLKAKQITELLVVLNLL